MSTLEDIRAYWEQAAAQPVDADGLKPTARDPYLQQAVEQAIDPWIWPGARVLDIGCGDGASTLRLAFRAGAVHGVDFIRANIARARQEARRRQIENVTFACGDATNLTQTRMDLRHVDIILTIRCLINLGTWTNQVRALHEIAATVHPGGLYLLSEGWTEGWDGLNRQRERCGLDPIELASHNCLIDRTRLEQEICPYFDIVHYQNLGFYVFLSRIVQPLLVAPAAPSHLHDLNRIAAHLSGLGIGAHTFADLDYAGVYVLRRM